MTNLVSQRWKMIHITMSAISTMLALMPRWMPTLVKAMNAMDNERMQTNERMGVNPKSRN